MAWKVAARRQLASVSASAVPRASCHRARCMSSATSNLADQVKQTINRDASLPNPDPTPDSPSAALVNDHAPFMLATYARPTPVFTQGEGSYLWDIENRKYLDFTSGIAVNALGHCDPGFTRLISQQAKTLIHTSNLYHNPWTLALSKLLIEKTLASGAMHQAASVFVCNSGSEANEAAIKLARKVGKVLDPSGAKHEFVSFDGAFHGRTMGALSATHNPKYQEPFSPMVPGFRLGEYNNIDKIDEMVTEKTCGVIVEPIQGEGGVNAGSDEFFVQLAKRCRQVGAILIYDEIQCGLSRTGRLWAHGHLPKEAHPDILTTAKALGNGFPVGAVLATKDVSDKIKIGDHGSTFGGNPLACRLAHYMVNRLSETELQESVVAKGQLFRDGFEKLRARFPELISTVRGKGLILGLQLTRDPSPIIKAARERGLLIITAGVNTLRVVPPLTISDEEIHEGLGILEEAIAATMQ